MMGQVLGPMPGDKAAPDWREPGGRVVLVFTGQYTGRPLVWFSNSFAGFNAEIVEVTGGLKSRGYYVDGGCHWRLLLCNGRVAVDGIFCTPWQ